MVHSVFLNSLSALADEVHQDYLKYYTRQYVPSEHLAFIKRYHAGIMLLGYALLCWWGYSRAKRNAGPLIGEGKWVLRGYNIFQVVFSGYIAYLAATTYLKTLVTSGSMCQPMDIDYTATENEWYVSQQTYTCYLFYISKLVDILDTVFIIIRAKWRQLSFLHVFHHTSVIFLGWMAIYYHPCGFYHISIQLNAPMHFIMYFYYFLSSFPRVTPHLWWKKYITTLQLTQFVVGSAMALYCFLKRFLLGASTGLSLIYTFSVIFYGIILLSLFTDFYTSTYKADKSIKDKKK